MDVKEIAKKFAEQVKNGAGIALPSSKWDYQCMTAPLGVGAVAHKSVCTENDADEPTIVE